MRTAKATDWRTESLPSERTTISVERVFSQEEMHRIRRGLVPEQMEDKWFIYWEDDALFFHRSWTGVCVYVVRFVSHDGVYKMVQADVNRDPDQYSESIHERDVEKISYLINVLLLHQEADFPSDEPSPEKKALMNWSLVGRAMLGQYPGDDS
jgi:hypothetical protein